MPVSSTRRPGQRGGGGQFGQFSPLRFNWSTPIYLSPHNANIVYMGAQNLFRSENVVGTRILDVLKVIIVFFLVVEIASIFIGILLTKSITNAIHSLDRGTEFVKKGDFSLVYVSKRLGRVLSEIFDNGVAVISTTGTERPEFPRAVTAIWLMFGS